MAIEKLICLRCEYEWYPRSEKLPRTCPNPACNSPYWNKPRTKEVVERIHKVENDFIDGISLFSQQQVKIGETVKMAFWKSGTWKGYGRYYTPGCRTVYDRLYLHTFQVQKGVMAIVDMPNVGVHLDSYNDAIDYKTVVCLPDRKLKIIKEKEET